MEEGENSDEKESEEVVVKRSRVKKHRLSSSDSDNEIQGRVSNEEISTPQSVKVVQVGSRSSERLKSKKSKIFHMPSRDEVLGKIKSDNLRKLSPKKLINNFSRINNRYNAENIDVFEDSSLSDFIDDSGDPSDPSTSDSESKKKHRVKNLKKRKSRSRIIENDSNSESENEITQKSTNISTVKDTADSTYSTITNSEDNSEYLQKHTYSDSSCVIDTKTTKCKCEDNAELGSYHSKKSGFEATHPKTPGFEANHSKTPGFEATHSETSGFEATHSKTSGSEAMSDVDSLSDDENIRAVRKRQLSTFVLDSDESSSENKSAKCRGHSLRETEKKSNEKRKLLFKCLKDARAKHSKPS